MYTLRPYQESVLQMMKLDFQRPGNSVVCIPTGGGKSLLIASLAEWINQDILILCYTKEILEQNYSKLSQLVPKEEIGIYSFSCRKKEIAKYTLATINSVYKKSKLFSHFKVIIIDELHTVPHKSMNSMYMKFMKDIGSPKVFGFSGTPYRCETWGERLKNGYILSHTTTKLVNRCYKPFWTRILVSISTYSLIKQGYLCQPNYIEKEVIRRETIVPNASHSDFDLTRLEKRFLTKEADLMGYLTWAKKKHKRTLVFCVSVAQALHLSDLVSDSAVVYAETPPFVRERIIDDFKAGIIKMVFNVNCLSTGFDLPELDCIVCLRPTNSIGLHVQQLGRGLRIAEGKKCCDIIDLVGNVKKLGKVEDIRVEKVNDKYDIVSNTGCWHGVELHSYLIKPTT